MPVHTFLSLPNQGVCSHLGNPEWFGSQREKALQATTVPWFKLAVLSSQASWRRDPCRPEPVTGATVTADAKGQLYLLDSQGRNPRMGIGSQEPSRRPKSDLLWPITLNGGVFMSREHLCGVDILNACFQDLSFQDLLRKCNFSLRRSVSETSWAVRPFPSKSPAPGLCWDPGFSHLSTCIAKDAAKDRKEGRVKKTQGPDGSSLWSQV